MNSLNRLSRIGSLVVTGLLVLGAFSARADVAVLVHGYLGNAASWEYSGVNAALEGGGWPRAGVVVMGPGGPRIIRGPDRQSANKSYSVELPSMAPVMVQSDILGAMLKQISKQNPGEPMVLVGHSAGGVVARTALVRGYAPDARGLITIAAPHLGTVRAVQALDYTDDGWPVSWFKEFFSGGIYDVLQDSWGLLVDLVPPAPGTFLYWLNGQPHPDIRYVSIVRTGPVGLGDQLVPAYSQDMNNVPVLKGQSEVRVTPAGHRLTPADGALLVGILNGAETVRDGLK